jgi:hypothetical protein
MASRFRQGNSVKQLQKFESEREGLNKMVIAYTDNPGTQLGQVNVCA